MPTIAKNRNLFQRSQNTFLQKFFYNTTFENLIWAAYGFSPQVHMRQYIKAVLAKLKTQGDRDLTGIEGSNASAPVGDGRNFLPLVEAIFTLSQILLVDDEVDLLETLSKRLL